MSKNKRAVEGGDESVATESEAEAPVASQANAGQMIVTFFEDDGVMWPVVTFPNTGKITEQRLESVLNVMYKQLRIARAIERSPNLQQATEKELHNAFVRESE